MRAVTKPSDYIGTETEYKLIGYISGQITPTTDNYSIANYGERVSRMYSVNTAYETDVKNGDKLVINGEECKIVGILQYSSHKTATVERTGKLWKSKSET